MVHTRFDRRNISCPARFLRRGLDRCSSEQCCALLLMCSEASMPRACDVVAFPSPLILSLSLSLCLSLCEQIRMVLSHVPGEIGLMKDRVASFEQAIQLMRVDTVAVSPRVSDFNMAVYLSFVRDRERNLFSGGFPFSRRVCWVRAPPCSNSDQAWLGWLLPSSGSRLVSFSLCPPSSPPACPRSLPREIEKVAA
jgi:hypothetical protein